MAQLETASDGASPETPDRQVSERSGPRPSRRLPLALSAAALVLAGWPAVAVAGRALPHWLTDDAYYYFTIARNLRDGLGLTFDGLHLTNGFHPLWLLVSAGVYEVVPGDDLPLRVMMVVQAGLIAAATWQLAAELDRRVGKAATILCVCLLCFLPRSLADQTAGMESALVLFLLVSCFRAQRWAERGRAWWKWAALGGLWALAILARLECAAALAAPGLSVAVSHASWRDRARRLAGLVLAPTVAVSAYLAWNLAVFGHLLPINARVKAHWNVLEVSPSTLAQKLLETPWLGHTLARRLSGLDLLSQGSALLKVLYLGVTTAFVVWVVIHRRALGARIREARAGVLLGSCAVMVAAGYLAQGTAYHNYTWQHTPLHLFNAVFFGVWIGNLRIARTLVTIVVCTLGLVQAQREAALAPRSFSWSMSNLAYRMRATVPADARVGSWNAGTVGYYSHRRVVNLDGLVNDHEYFERIFLQHEFEEYLMDTDVRWIADVACHGRSLPAPLAHPLFALRSCEPVLESRWDFPYDPCFAGLWRLRCGPVGDL